MRVEIFEELCLSALSTMSLGFPQMHFFRALPLPGCFAIKQKAVDPSLFVKFSSVIIDPAWKKAHI